MEQSKLVPFGKYKGQPVEVLAQDREYCDWLMEQDWFRVKFQPIYTVIVNNFGEPSETPEHNRLQAKFTDPDFCRRFVWHVKAADIAKDFDGDKQFCLSDCAAKLHQARQDLDDHRKWYSEQAYAPYLHRIKENEANIAQLENRVQTIKAMPEPQIGNVDTTVEFEVRGIDVMLNWTVAGFPGGRCRHTLSVECKPALGDDYPAVLRQITPNEPPGYVPTRVLLVGDGGFTATGAALEQVRLIFESRKVVIVFLEELD